MRAHLRSLSHTTLVSAIALLALPINCALAQQLQMLPPTNYGTSTPCNVTNGLLTYSGSYATGADGKPVSAINCVGGANLDSAGNLTSGGNLNFAGQGLFSGSVGIGTTLPRDTGLSGAGANLLLANPVVLDVNGDIVTETGHIVSGYNGPSVIKGALALDAGPWVDANTSGGVGIYFRSDNVLGKPGYGNLGYRDLMFLRADGKLGIGTDSPQSMLDVAGWGDFSGLVSVYAVPYAVSGVSGWGAGIEFVTQYTNSGAFPNGSRQTIGPAPAQGAQGWTTGAVTADDPSYPSQFRIAYSDGASWYPSLMISPNGNAGFGTYAPQGTVDIENTTHDAKLCLNGACVNAIGASSFATTVGEVDNACLGTDPNPPNYNMLQYQVTCGSRFCHSKNYVFGLVNESAPGLNGTSPYNSPASTSLVVSCTGGTGAVSSGAVAAPSSPTPPVCTGSHVLQFDGSNYNCVAVTASALGVHQVTATGGWTQDSYGSFYAGATATCPAGEVLIGGGASCDSTNGAYLIYNIPSGSAAYYGSCHSLPPGPENGNGVTTVAICAH